MIVSYMPLPIIQRKCDTLVDLWNSNRIRSQNNLELPNGVPNHMLSLREQYGGTQKGITVIAEFLRLSIDMETLYKFH